MTAAALIAAVLTVPILTAGLLIAACAWHDATHGPPRGRRTPNRR